ncbi:MAG: DUF3137 domain-containing protein [Alphaproteobacteria bacterium]|nr:DUF3137 domain-containing protein [Alphaproteobacteria bacterium]
MIDITKDAEYIELKKKFDEYYTESLYPVLKKNERSRYFYLSYVFVLLLMGFVFYPTIMWYILHSPMMQDRQNPGMLLAASGAVLMLLCGPLYLYRKKVKPDIMPMFANFFGDFEYLYEQVLDSDLLVASDLFGKFNQNIGDDYFCDTYDDVRITVAEEKLRQVHADDKGNIQKKKVFTGICILLEMNKNFVGRTVVLEDKGLFNVFNRVKGLQNVKLEDSKFEKYFEVYADSQIESRYLLTTAFMERMLKLRDLYHGTSLQFNFSDNKLLIAIRTKENMFEANSFWRTNLNRKRINRVFDQFYTIFSIIRILKLNQRIGM